MSELAAEAPREGLDVPAAGAALLTVTLWASAFVGIRSAGHHFSPGALALGRLLVSSAALGVLVLVRREPLPTRRDLPLLALCGVLWFGLYSVVLNSAERKGDAGTESMLVNTGPILIALSACLRQASAQAAARLRGRVLGRRADRRAHVERRRPGAGAPSACSRPCSTRAASSRRSQALARVSPLMVTWVACTAGTILCLPFASSRWQPLPRPAESRLGRVPRDRMIGFIAWSFALSRTTAGRMGSTSVPRAADRDPARLGCSR
jgi:drug/metabolite transporter (DMT)-like permease